MNQPDLHDMARRLRVIEDELAIRGLAARFTDAVNERNRDAFRQLWAEDAVWEIGPPLSHIAKGVDAIVDMFDELLKPRTLFVQMTHSGVVEFTGENTALARFTERERGRGPKDYYENLAVYRDEFIRTADGWRFKRRYYDYRYLDMSAFPGEVIPLPGNHSAVHEG